MFVFTISMLFNYIIMILPYFVTAMLVGYLLGSLPYGLILVKIFKGVDIRTIGSKNIGATNVLRAGYTKLAIATLLLDAIKGMVAVLLFKYVIFVEQQVFITAGFFAIMGHIYPAWLNFKGGKGVSTYFGTLLAVNPILGVLGIAVWLFMAFVFKYSSLSALTAFVIVPLVSFFLYPNVFVFLFITSTIIIIKHKENIKRLIYKQETKIKLKKS